MERGIALVIATIVRHARMTHVHKQKKITSHHATCTFTHSHTHSLTHPLARTPAHPTDLLKSTLDAGHVLAIDRLDDVRVAKAGHRAARHVRHRVGRVDQLDCAPFWSGG